MKKQLFILLTLVVFIIVGCTPAEESPAPEVSNETAIEATQEDGIKQVDIEAVKAALTSEDMVVVDARPMAGFNGWILGEEARGGHIEGAVVFDSTWIGQFETRDALTSELEKYGVTKDKSVIVYGAGADAQVLAQELVNLAYENVSFYEGGIVEWAANTELPMAHMANYEYLVSAQWVNDLIAGKEVEAYDGKDYIIFEASWGPGDKYAEGHIPGAVHINTDEYEVGPLWNRVSDGEILKSTLANGITKDTMVVLYGADTTPAARIAILLKYLGVKDVRLMDGGYQAWTSAGFEIATGMVNKVPVTDFGTDGQPQHKAYIIDMPEAESLLKDENGRLISIRSWAEYIGETSGYDYIEAAGRIDGAVYGYAGSDPWHMEDFRNVDNTAVNYEYMAKRWADQDILPTTANAFYCGTGWRAAETWFYAHAMGWENVALYDGGWKEWSEAEMPSLKGDPTK